jgi:hypothetical protein
MRSRGAGLNIGTRVTTLARPSRSRVLLLACVGIGGPMLRANAVVSPPTRVAGFPCPGDMAGSLPTQLCRADTGRIAGARHIARRRARSGAPGRPRRKLIGRRSRRNRCWRGDVKHSVSLCPLRHTLAPDQIGRAQIAELDDFLKLALRHRPVLLAVPGEIPLDRLIAVRHARSCARPVSGLGGTIRRASSWSNRVKFRLTAAAARILGLLRPRLLDFARDSQVARATVRSMHVGRSLEVRDARRYSCRARQARRTVNQQPRPRRRQTKGEHC